MDISKILIEYYLENSWYCGCSCMRHVPCIGKVQGDMRPCLLLCMSHLLVMYNRNHSCLVSSHFGVLVERLVSVVVKCVVKDQQVGPFCSSFVYVAIIFFFQFGRTNKKYGEF